MLKIKIFFPLSLTFSLLANAGSMGPVCLPGQVSLPCLNKNWDFGIQALYLRPSYTSSLSEFTTISGLPVFPGFPVSANPTLTVHDFSAKSDWAYRLQGSYHYDLGSDISANYTRLNANNTLGLFQGQYLQLLPGGASEVLAAPFNFYLSNHYEQANIVVGQRVNQGFLQNTRFYGGLQYAQVRVDSKSMYSLLPVLFAGTQGVSDYTNTDFSGFGPVIGLDYAYELNKAFSITANTAYSLLYGTSRYSFSTNYGNGLVVAGDYRSRKTVVSGLEAKLGANYAYHLGTGGILNLEGGYQALSYLNALQGAALTPVLRGVVYSSDFGLYGPYLGLRWLG